VRRENNAGEQKKEGGGGVGQEGGQSRKECGRGDRTMRRAERREEGRKR
jgi:hypothetical protein